MYAGGQRFPEPGERRSVRARQSEEARFAIILLHFSRLSPLPHGLLVKYSFRPSDPCLKVGAARDVLDQSDTCWINPVFLALRHVSSGLKSITPRLCYAMLVANARKMPRLCLTQ